MVGGMGTMIRSFKSVRSIIIELEMLFIKYGFTWAITFVGMRLFPTSSAPYGYNMRQILHGSVLSKKASVARNLVLHMG